MLLKRRLSNLVVNKSFVSLTLTDRSYNLPYVWLSDHCSCLNCMSRSSLQKLKSSGQAQEHALSVRIGQLSGSSALQVQWNKDHLSTFTKDMLQRLLIPAKASPLSVPSFWKENEVNTTPITFSELMTSPNSSLKQLQSQGIVFISSIPKNVTVETLALKFGPIQETFYGKTWSVISKPSAKNIAYTSVPLPLHMDLLYFEAPPGLQFLHCLKNSVKGGSSLFLDSYLAVDILKQENKEAYEALTGTICTIIDLQLMIVQTSCEFFIRRLFKGQLS